MQIPGIDAEKIRRSFQRSTASMRRRRTITALAAFGAIDSLLVALRQTGALRHLPDPPLPGFESDYVTTSRAAYDPGVPDATLGALMFVAVAVAANFFGEDGSLRRRLVAWAAAGIALAGAAGAVHYLKEMKALRRYCLYCLGTAAASLALVPATVVEARAS